jgi:tRNA U55 pseudouridine synthase TruB
MNMINGRSCLLENFDGIILIDKLPGVVSYDVIREIKKVFF